MMGNDQRRVEVYVATNKINGKKYVGITRTSLAKRVYQHNWMAINKKSYGIFAAAIRKYRIDSFNFETVTVVSSWTEALEIERRMIRDDRPEYNVSAGGVGPNGLTWTPEWREKALAGLRRSWTSERKAKMSDMLRGKAPSREAVEKMKAKNPWKARYRGVVCLNDGKVYESIISASSYYGIKPNQIRSCCTGAEISAHGLSFEYHSGQDLSDTQRKEKLLALGVRRRAVAERRRMSRCRSVVCCNTGTIYESAKAAAVANQISIMRVSQICRHGGQTKYGLQFRYVGHPEPPDVKVRSPDDIRRGRELRRAGLQKAHAKARKKVVCIDTGHAFDSLTHAARETGVCIESLSASIRRNGKCRKMRFALVDGAS